jgi:hypothetical protein
MARCEPSRPCQQAAHCARHVADGFHEEVDASSCIGPEGCGMFLDQRGLALLSGEPRQVEHRTEVRNGRAVPAQWFSPISREAA